MLIFDQLKRNDPKLRALTGAVLAGFAVLLAGLWYVQIVSWRSYQESLETQSFRTVRIPAVRGKILDRNGIALAENQPTYHVSLYLEELRKPFDAAYFKKVSEVRAELKRKRQEFERAKGSKLTKTELKQFVLSGAAKTRLKQAARYEVASNVVWTVGKHLQVPLALNPTNFQRHYEARLALPLAILPNVDATNIARFQEQLSNPVGVDVEIQSTRFYPFQTLAAHVLGRLTRDDSSAEGEEAYFSFRLPDYRGLVGVEFGNDKDLRGVAGAKSVLVNNMGYRHTESLWSPAEPGKNVVLTLDFHIQRAVEQSLPIYGAATRGAAVVMEVETGDILAMASCPTMDPNSFIQGLSHDEWRRISELQAEKNRATQMNYAPGSIFKPIVGLACLEAGLDPRATIYNPGHIYVGRRSINDLAPAGTYDFRRAILHSSNTYFITNGLRFGLDHIVELGRQLHLGERTGLNTKQEVDGIFPDQKRISANWFPGDTANICIGQGQMAVTPLQMAVMTAALANGGRVLRPRLVDRIEEPGPNAADTAQITPRGSVRDTLRVRPQNLRVLHEAMLADVEDPEGTGTAAAIPGFRICGKTGTAQVMNERNHIVGHTTWFVAFAPYEKPRYAVVVMIEDGKSGGKTCAPIAKEIFTAILAREAMGNQVAHKQ